jgi:hypothetical protein
LVCSRRVVSITSEMPDFHYPVNGIFAEYLPLVGCIGIAAVVAGGVIGRRIAEAGAAVRSGGGRHRRGAPRIAWTRIRWDVRERAAAAGLDMVEPCWLVIYRVWARSFYAVPAWPLPGSPGVEAPTIAGLRALMRQAEADARGPGWARA